MRGPMSDTIIPIQIRPDIIIYIQGIPHDLSQSEAKKIANIVLGYGLINGGDE